MKILSLNTWQECGPWQKRWEVIFDEIERSAPDLVVFQEVFNVDWVREVQKRFAYKTLVLSGEHSGLIFLAHFELKNQATHVMKTKSPTETYLRYALFAEFEVGKRRLNVFNTHLSWQLDEGNVRERQVEELLAFICEKSKGKENMVMGDFNAAPSSREIKKMIETGKFLDTFAHLYPGQAGLTWSNENDYARGASHPLPDRRIDYLFIQKDSGFLADLQSIELVMEKPTPEGIWASDHFGLLAAFK